MSLITKKHLSLLLQTIQKLLSFKIDRSEIATEQDAIEMLAELGYITPAAAADGAIYINANGEIYSL